MRFIIIALTCIVLFSVYKLTKKGIKGIERISLLAKEKTNDLPVITCDYCGGAIDTAKDKVCPICGAPYDQDAEWINRGEKTEPELPGKAIPAEKHPAKKKVNGKKIKIVMLAAGCIAALCLIAVLIANRSISDPTRQYVSENQVLNGSYEYYVETDYRITGDGVLAENDDVKIAVTGLYYDEERKDFKIGFCLENKTEKPLRFEISAFALNHLATSHYSCWLYETVAAQTSVVIYDWTDAPPQKDIASISFDRISVEDMNYNYVYRDLSIQELTTTAVVDLSFDSFTEKDARTVFNENSITIRTAGPVYLYGDDDKYAAVCITNNSGNQYTVRMNDARVNGESCDCFGFYDKPLPDGYIFIGNNIGSFDEAYTSMQSGDHFLASIEFECVETPSQSFTTDYLVLF